MAFIGLYSGRAIKKAADNKEKITRTQTGKNAVKAIVKKYGSIQLNAKYQHKGKGNWVKYSLKNDKKRTGKTTSDIKKWRKQPHKLDYKGIDTKGSSKLKSKKKITMDDLHRHIKRIAKFIKNEGMEYSIIDENTIKFKNHVIKLANEKNLTVFYDGKEIKHAKIADFIRNESPMFWVAVENKKGAVYNAKNQLKEMGFKWYPSKKIWYSNKKPSNLIERKLTPKTSIWIPKNESGLKNIYFKQKQL